MHSLCASPWGCVSREPSSGVVPTAPPPPDLQYIQMGGFSKAAIAFPSRFWSDTDHFLSIETGVTPTTRGLLGWIINMDLMHSGPPAHVLLGVSYGQSAIEMDKMSDSAIQDLMVLPHPHMHRHLPPPPPPRV